MWSPLRKLFTPYCPKLVTGMDPLMDSLVVNDTCKHPITKLKWHFVYGKIMQMAHNTRKVNIQ